MKMTVLVLSRLHVFDFSELVVYFVNLSDDDVLFAQKYPSITRQSAENDMDRPNKTCTHCCGKGLQGVYMLICAYRGWLRCE